MDASESLKPDTPLISIIVPVYNEAANLPSFYEALAKAVVNLPYQLQILFVDDGSSDGSISTLRLLAKTDNRIEIIRLSRNFGKEIATTAGLQSCKGQVAIMVDADLQHPVELIPQFLARWRAGHEVVVGVRRSFKGESITKRFNSWLFYKILNSMSRTKIVPNSTDFRLVDRTVIDEFNRFSERNRITRGLIDWLGFDRTYIYFDAPRRVHGKASYSPLKLVRLAINSFVSLSLFPLRVAGYLGIVITLFSGLLGLFIFTEKYVLRDPARAHFSGPAILADINMFLIGIVLISLGLMALYVANIHDEVVNRPLYVTRRERAGFESQVDTFENAER